MSYGGSSIVPGSPQWQAAIEGSIRGHSASLVYILGQRFNGWSSNSAYGDVAQYLLDTTQADVNLPTFGTTYYLYSSSANDAAAGSGARTVRVVSLDNTGAQQVNTYILNGTTKVSIGATHGFFQWMEVETNGSASATAAGNISITSDGTVAAPTVANTFEYIKAGGNRSMSARYRVPTGFKFYALDWCISSVGNASMDARLRADATADSRVVTPLVFHFQENGFVSSNVNAVRELHYLTFPAGCTIKTSVIPSAVAAANRFDCSLHGLLVAA